MCVTGPPVRVVCLNYEVVVFQHWKGNAQYLGSVTSNTTFILALMPQLFQTFFWVALFTPSILPPSPISNRSFLYPLYLLHQLSTYSPVVKICAPVCCPHPPPSSLRRSTMCPAPHGCVCCCLPRLLVPPLLPFACAQVPLCPWGVLPS